jgi:hypothetical protein
MAGSLAVLRQSLQALVDELHIVGIDIETEQYQPSSGDTTDAVQEAQGLQDQVVAVLAVGLLPKVVLHVSVGNDKGVRWGTMKWGRGSRVKGGRRWWSGREDGVGGEREGEGGREGCRE